MLLRTLSFRSSAQQSISRLVLLDLVQKKFPQIVTNRAFCMYPTRQNVGVLLH